MSIQSWSKQTLIITLFVMFSNKQTTSNRINRLTPSANASQRSRTPNNLKRQKNSSVSYSQSKNILPDLAPISKQNLLTPINEQIVYERPYYLGKGNNHEVIKRILNRRKKWGESVNQQFVYLRWVQNSQSFKFHLLGKQVYCFNHFEYHRELSNKQRLVQNMINFCESNKLNVYNYIPVTYILDLSTGEEDLALHSFLKFYNRNHPDNNQPNSRRHHSIILPRAKHFPYFTAQQLNKRSQGNFYCKPNWPRSFTDPENKPYIWILKPTFLNRGRGVALFRTLDELQKMIWKYYEGQGLQDYGEKYHNNDNIMQKVEQSPKKIEQQQLQKKNEDEIEDSGVEKRLSNSEPIIKSEASSMIKIEENKQIIGKQQSADKMNTSLEKSAQKSKEGDLSKSPTTKQEEDKTINYSSNKYQNSTRCMNFVIQKYIEQPMLIENKKFDIRVWVLLTHTLEVYVFEDAYLRFSSHQYTTKSSHNNPFIHLTNNSVQKYSNQYDKTTGNQWALSDIIPYIKPENKAESTYAAIVKKIKDIVWLSMCSVRRKININSRKICFELFGYDFMIDKEYKVWLIEVNTNPALEESGPLLKMLVPRMIDDMFKLTIDKILNNQMKEDIEELNVSGRDNDKNMFEYIGDLKEGSNEKNGKRLTFARR